MPQQDDDDKKNVKGACKDGIVCRNTHTHTQRLRRGSLGSENADLILKTRRGLRGHGDAKRKIRSKFFFFFGHAATDVFANMDWRDSETFPQLLHSAPVSINKAPGLQMGGGGDR